MMEDQFKQLQRKSDERDRVVRNCVSEVHRHVGAMEADEADRELVYLNVARELLRSLDVSLKTEQTKRMMLEVVGA
jgi:flagellin-specific chaperone FliS